MNKLIELLNEYDPGNQPITKIEGQGIDLVISKRFGFIKWLVDNDKINIDKYREEYSENNLYCNSDFFKLLEYYDVYESLLMVLAIQDKQIEFLISILK